MRRRIVALLGLAALTASAAAAAVDPLQARARDVRNAIPAAEAYNADHGTYGGMTLAKLRRAYDHTLRNVAVARATKTGYCIESTLRPFVHYDGPAGPLRRGRCGVRGNVVPRPGETPPTEAATPEQRLRFAVPAIEAFAADHGGYAGMTLEALQRYDAGVADIRIAWTTRTAYCAESGTGANTHHRVGPAGDVRSGACPPAPAR